MARVAKVIPKKTVHRLKVTLRDVHPAVWRRIELLSSTSLPALSIVLEAAMGWRGGHLHAFEAGDVTYELPNDDIVAFGVTVDERTVHLAEVVPEAGTMFRWDYDFGDGWEHDVLVEAVEPRQLGVVYPRCLAGERACPPDDCGGPWGYANVLASWADPDHPDRVELSDWLPPGFDPEAFDVAATTERLLTAGLG